MNFAIETENLSRRYLTYEKPEGIWNSIRGVWSRKYHEKIALHPTSLKIESGKIVGLVGANGAGKTTLLKCLSGLVAPSSGSARVLGYDPSLRQDQYLKRISILLGQKNQLWWDIPPADSFSLLAKIYELDEAKAKSHVRSLAKLLLCEHVLHTQLRRLSLGERMKMELIGALLHEPEVLFLDEPTIGLDIVAQNTIRDFLSEYVKSRGPTVILTSHYMDDITTLSDRLLLISKGNLVYDGDVKGFTSTTENKMSLFVRFQTPLQKNVFIHEGLELQAGSREYHISFSPETLQKVLSKTIESGQVLELKTEEVDFEDVIHRFLQKESSLR